MNLINGDCLEKLKALPSDSIDSLVTDPPAGISFMGKGWDSDKGGRDHWIKWMAEVMREVHRVLKPGAHGLVWALPRTSHWTATACEDAGFEIRDIVHHLFGSGFPKSQNIALAIDKQAGAIGNRGKGFNAAGQNVQLNQNKELRSDHPEYKKPEFVTDSAKQWAGWGTALKPAAENWILVRKPCSEKTVAANVLKHGTGGINIDAGRIEAADQHVLDAAVKRMTGNKVTGWVSSGCEAVKPNSNQGRFPANLVFSHSHNCTEEACDMFECAVAALDEQSAGTRAAKPSKSGSCQKDRSPFLNENQGGLVPAISYSDSGGASRFFYCAKISSSERNAGLGEMPDKVMAMSGGAAAAAARGESYDNGDSGMNRTRVVKNVHPTVKPKKLMTYLIKLITPPNGVVLDPFMGSGSTGLAAKEAGFGFVGIEREREYFEIAKARIGE